MGVITTNVMTTEFMAVGIQPAGYRLPEQARVGRVRLQVSDLLRSIPYYTDVLGCAVSGRDDGRAVLATAEGAPLIELYEQKGIRPVPRHGRLGLYHFAILLPDRQALGRFVAHLSEVGAYAGSADHLVSEALYLADPDGLGIEVYADRPRGQWKTNGREIAMATEPLDLRALVRAGAGEPWIGMPAGTTIGHVHFHVTTLRDAEAFYHSALGFDKVVWSYPGALFFSAGGYHHHVGTNTWAAGAPIATAHDARLLEWELRLPAAGDVASAAASAAHAGYEIREAGDDRLITDPSGITVRLTTQGVTRDHSHRNNDDVQH
jgi:catechol 2,3-dioxygenase